MIAVRVRVGNLTMTNHPNSHAMDMILKSPY